MKKLYVQPEFEVTKLLTEDILQGSDILVDAGDLLYDDVFDVQ